MPPSPVILGLESSCDETAAAVVAGGTSVRSNVIASQHELHREYAGVVPEIASRAHLERLVPVVRRALADAGTGWDDLDAIAVGHRPGLIGSLLVAVSAAKALAWSLERPLIGIDHVAAHLHGGRLEAPPVQWPALGLVVSGGHTSLFAIAGPGDLRRVGRTIDDAVGEAFDKAATILGLGYPGGPEIDRAAAHGDDRAHDLPIARLGRESLDFSFSGLKTALLYAVRDAGGPEALDDGARADFAASFQRAATAPILLKLERAAERFPAPTLLVGGGVSANRRLRRELAAFADDHGMDLRLPPVDYCLDNAAMIAGAAADRFARAAFDDLTLAASTRSGAGA